MPGGPAYAAAIAKVWDAGDAIAPLDLRLPKAETDRVLAALAPSAIIEPDGEERSLPDGVATEDGDAAVIATSGTSGLPKGVVHTHASVEASARATSNALGVQPDRDKWLACLPLSHVGGLAVVMRSLVTGTPVEVHDGFDADAAIDAAGRGATLVSLVTRALNQVSPTLFRTVLIGGAAPPPDRPANVIATYGMTETGSGVVYDTTPLDGLEIRLADDGEIQLRGPMLFRGYRSGPSPFLADGWFPTGDLGSWSDEGHLVVAGRRGDVIVTGGEKVWPDPVERLLLARPDVAQVALIGRADKDWGHRVVAVIVTETGHRPPELDSIRATVAEDLPVWAAPKELEFVDDLPRTSLGKVKRNLL
jgi:O-succinylbenzoic acid--CoA ligase